MSTWVIRYMGTVGTVTGPNEPVPQGAFLKSYADAGGRGDSRWTSNALEAMVFDEATEAWDFWSQASPSKPTRPDGRPNRPLTAFTISVERLALPAVPETPPEAPVIIEAFSMDALMLLKPKHIYYGANTPWWTHDPAHLGRRSIIPTDPRGGVLFETDDVAGFLREAFSKPEHYGRHGLRAFMAAHHLNCRRGLDDPRPWCFDDWEGYNDALDALDARKEAQASG